MRLNQLVVLTLALLSLDSAARADGFRAIDSAKSLNEASSKLNYTMNFQSVNCEQDANYVCDVYVKAPGLETIKIMLSAASETSTPHFNFIGGSPLMVLSIVVVANALSSTSIGVSDVGDAIKEASEKGASRLYDLKMELIDMGIGKLLKLSKP